MQEQERARLSRAPSHSALVGPAPTPVLIQSTRLSSPRTLPPPRPLGPCCPPSPSSQSLAATIPLIQSLLEHQLISLPQCSIGSFHRATRTRTHNRTRTSSILRRGDSPLSVCFARLIGRQGRSTLSFPAHAVVRACGVAPTAPSPGAATGRADAHHRQGTRAVMRDAR